MNEICVGKAINDVDSGAQFLVLWVASDNEYGYWYDLNSSSRKPAKFIASDVIAGENGGKYEVADHPFESSRPESTLSETEKVHRDKIWAMMRAAVEQEPEIYDGKTRMKILRKVGNENDVDPRNLYRFLDKYWRSGKTKNAYIPSFHKRGAQGSIRQSEKKIGRKPLDGSTGGKIITEKDRANFASAIKSYYLNRKKVTLTVVYEKLLKDFYSIKPKHGVGQLKLLPQDELPSMHQFRYWYSRNRDIVFEQKKRDGESAFELSGRSVLGKSDFGLMGPGAQFQIDATVGDIYLVSQFDRSNLIGRPVMYFVIDAFSRMVTGVNIALEGPSWASAMITIANMATSKVAYCKEYGVEITEDEWPCHHLPTVLRGDRGEMESKHADNLVNMLNIRIENTPPYRADLKGIIEQHFRTININSVALLPGSVKPDMSKRGGRDYRLDAKLDIRQFTQIIIKCVLHYNNHHYMDYFERNEAMMSDRVEPIPAKLWEWGIKNYSGALRSMPEKMVRLAVLPTDKASVTGKGIRFKGLYYSSDRAVRDAWFEKARSKKAWQVAVSYDPRDMANIYVWNNDDKAYDTCSLLDWNNKYTGKCLDEVVYEQRMGKIVAKRLKSSETESKVNLNAEIDAIVAEAQKMGKGVPHKSKRERVSQIQENRKQEREAIRSSSAAITESTDGTSVVSEKTVANEDEMSPTLRMIKQKLEERLKND